MAHPACKRQFSPSWPGAAQPGGKRRSRNQLALTDGLQSLQPRTLRQWRRGPARPRASAVTLLTASRRTQAGYSATPQAGKPTTPLQTRASALEPLGSAGAGHEPGRPAGPRRGCCHRAPCRTWTCSVPTASQPFQRAGRAGASGRRGEHVEPPRPRRDRGARGGQAPGLQRGQPAARHDSDLTAVEVSQFQAQAPHHQT